MRINSGSARFLHAIYSLILEKQMRSWPVVKELSWTIQLFVRFINLLLVQMLYYTFCAEYQINNLSRYFGGSKTGPTNSLPYSHPNTHAKTLSGTNFSSIHPQAKHCDARYDPHNRPPQNNFIEANYRFGELRKKSKQLFLKEKKKRASGHQENK